MPTGASEGDCRDLVQPVRVRRCLARRDPRAQTVCESQGWHYRRVRGGGWGRSEDDRVWRGTLLTSDWEERIRTDSTPNVRPVPPRTPHDTQSSRNDLMDRQRTDHSSRMGIVNHVDRGASEQEARNVSLQRKAGAKGSREEAINTVVANLLTEEHNLRTVPEQRVHGRRKVPDLTIRPTLECPHTIFGEAKVGTSGAQKHSAAKQAKEWTESQPRNAPKRLALAVCYPTELRDDLTPGEMAHRLRETQKLEWMFVAAGAKAGTWRIGDLATLATEIRNVSEHQGDVETLLTGIIVEAANLWVHERENASASLAEVLNMQPTNGSRRQDVAHRHSHAGKRVPARQATRSQLGRRARRCSTSADRARRISAGRVGTPMGGDPRRRLRTDLRASACLLDGTARRHGDRERARYTALRRRLVCRRSRSPGIRCRRADLPSAAGKRSVRRLVLHDAPSGNAACPDRAHARGLRLERSRCNRSATRHGSGVRDGNAPAGRAARSP